MAPEVFRLRAQPNAWLNRRVETVRLSEPRIVRRSISVDITVPRATGLRSKVAQTILLPLLLMRKRPLRAFDLTDSDGAALSLLTSHENAVISVAVLRYVALLTLRSDAKRRGTTAPTQLSKFSLRFIDLVVSSTPHQARRLEGLLNTVATDEPTSECAILNGSGGFRSWLELLGQNFVMYVPVAAAEGERRVIKFSYDEELPTWSLTLSMRLALEPALISIAASVLGTQSYHTEVVVPRELVIEKASIRRRLLDQTPTTLTEERMVSRAHLYVHDHPRSGAYAYTIDIWLRTRVDGLLQTAAAVGVITTSLLLGGAVLVTSGSVAFKPDPATAIIIALPAAYAAYVAVQAEDPVAERFLSGLRLAILAFAAATFLAALSLVVLFEPDSTRLVWTILGVLSLDLTIVLGFAWARGMMLRRG